MRWTQSESISKCQQDDLRYCQVDTTGMSLRSMMMLHSELYG